MCIDEMNNGKIRFEKDLILISRSCKISGHFVLGWKKLNEITEYYRCPCYRHIFIVLNIIWTQRLWIRYNEI